MATVGAGGPGPAPGGVVVVRLGGSKDYGDLEARLAGAESEVAALRDEIAGLEASRGVRDLELAEARAPFSSEFLAAVGQVQGDVADAACRSGRSAARKGQPVPIADEVVGVVASRAEAGRPVLVTVENWISLSDVGATDAEVRRCHDDEMQLIDEEQRAAEEARSAAETEARTAEEAEEDGESESSVDRCASGDASACADLSDGELDELCSQGVSEACFQLNGPLSPEEVEEKVEGAECRWRGDGSGYFWNLDTGEELYASPDFNPCA